MRPFKVNSCIIIIAFLLIYIFFNINTFLNPAGTGISDAGNMNKCPKKFHVYDLPPSLRENLWSSDGDPWFDFSGTDSHHLLEYHLANLLPLHRCHTKNRTEGSIFFIPGQWSLALHKGLGDTYINDVFSHIKSYPESKKNGGIDHFTTASFFYHPSRLEASFPNIKLVSPEIFPGFLERTIVTSYVEYTFNSSSELNYNIPKKDLCVFFGSLVGGPIRTRAKVLMDKRNDTHGDCSFHLLDDRWNLEGISALTLKAKFGFVFRGDTLSSRRPFSLMFAGVIPVIVCDMCVLPFEHIINYDEFCIFITEEMFQDENSDPISVLLAISENELEMKREKMFTSLPTIRYHLDMIVEGDAVDSIVNQLLSWSERIMPIERVAGKFLE